MLGAGLLFLIFSGSSLPTYGDSRASVAPLPLSLAPTLVIIIDDLGYHLDSGRKFVSLPGKLNMAFLPHTANAVELAQLAATNGKEVMLHAPMSNVQNRPLGPGALTPQLNEQQLRRTLANSLESMPFVRGINNHMGSELTAMRQPMEWVMAEVAERGLYFVDSRTTGQTLAATVAEEHRIPTLSRQVFLDNIPSREAIDRKFKHLLRLADRNQVAVAIGHPYPETLAYLQDMLPGLEAQGYRLALVSEVLAEQQILRAQLELEANLNTASRHVRLGLGHSELTEVENAGGEHGIGTAIEHPVDQMIEVANTP